MTKKERELDRNSLTSVPSIYPNTLLKIPITRRSSRKWIFQEDEYTDFVANDTIITLI